MDRLQHSAWRHTKIVTPAEMARVEALAIQEGCKEEAFIKEAGSKVASALTNACFFSSEKQVALLIGKGNKGADAYAAGCALAEEGFQVQAFALFSPKVCTKHNSSFREQFLKRGKIIDVWDGGEIVFEGGWIIDGMLGTGFKGKVDGVIEMAIRLANASHLPILAIDLPSGVNGSTGEVPSVAIRAFLTVSLGLAKIGCFLREGWNHTGRLLLEDFGLPAKFSNLANPIAYLPNPARMHLPTIVRSRHKYQAGYVIGFSGSNLMRGAPKLAGLAALRMGAGIVRVFHKGDIGEAPMELICRSWSAAHWAQELKRANAAFVGPGLGKGKLPRWDKINVPMVLDADALQEGMSFPAHAVLTPHRGEFLRLLGLERAPQEEELLARAQKFVEKKSRFAFERSSELFICSRAIAFGDAPRRSWDGNCRIGRCVNGNDCGLISPRPFLLSSGSAWRLFAWSGRRDRRAGKNFLWYDCFRFDCIFAFSNPGVCK